MSVGEILKDCASAQVVDAPAEIESRLRAMREQSSDAADLDVSRDDDGVVIRQPSGLVGGFTMPSADELKKLAEKRDLPWNEEYASRTVPYFASDETVDSYGDIVLQNWDFTVFARNPIMPFCHDWEGLPIGLALDWRVAQREYKVSPTRTYKGPTLLMLQTFATRDVSEFADSVFRLVKARILRGSSVGFRPRKLIDVQNPEEREKLGLGKWGYVLDDNLLLEHSPCALGANFGAGTFSTLAQAKAQGLFGHEDVRTLREISRRSGSKPTARLARDHQLVEIARALFPRGSFAPIKDVDEPLVAPETRAASSTPPAEEMTLQKLHDELMMHMEKHGMVLDEIGVEVAGMATDLRAFMAHQQDKKLDRNESTMSLNSLAKIARKHLSHRE